MDTQVNDAMLGAARAIVVALKDRKWVTDPASTGYAYIQPVEVHAVANLIAEALDAYGYLREP